MFANKIKQILPLALSRCSYFMDVPIKIVSPYNIYIGLLGLCQLM